MNQVDVKNSLIVNKMVKNHFSLSKKYQRIFTERLLYRRDIAKEFSSIIGNDLRYRVPLDLSNFEDSDSSFLRFKREFKDYVDKKNVTYKDFISGKVKTKSGEIKISKDLPSFYHELKLKKAVESGNKVLEKLIENLKEYDFVESNFAIHYTLALKNAMEDTGTYDSFFSFALEFYNIITSYHNFVVNSYSNNFFFETKVNLISSFKAMVFFAVYNRELFAKSIEAIDSSEFFNEIDYNVKSFKAKSEEHTKSFYKEKYERISLQKTFGSNDEYELVISLNYADWFLCSTSENWDSCLSLDSTYDSCFWMGLPQLIGDKSRAMVYVTKKGKKKNYNGIEVDSIIFRTWIQLARDKRGHETYISFVRQYPNNSFSLKKIVCYILGLKEMPEYSSSMVSRYYSENFWLKPDTNGYYNLTTIYLDNSSYRLSKKNKGKYFPLDYGYYIFSDSCGPFRKRVSSLYSKSDFAVETCLVEYGVSFTDLFEKGSSVIRHINNYQEDDYDYDYEEEDEVM